MRERRGEEEHTHTGAKEEKKAIRSVDEGIVKAGNGGYSEVLRTEIEKEPQIGV